MSQRFVLSNTYIHPSIMMDLYDTAPKSVRNKFPTSFHCTLPLQPLWRYQTNSCIDHVSPFVDKTLGEGEAYEGEVLPWEFCFTFVLVQGRGRLRLLELVEVGRVVFTRDGWDEGRRGCKIQHRNMIKSLIYRQINALLRL